MNRSRRECLDGNDLDPVVAGVAVASRQDDREEGRPADVVGVDPSSEAPEALGRLVGSSRPEPHLDRTPAAPVVDNGVHPRGCRGSGAPPRRGIARRRGGPAGRGSRRGARRTRGPAAVSPGRRRALPLRGSGRRSGARARYVGVTAIAVAASRLAGPPPRSGDPARPGRTGRSGRCRRRPARPAPPASRAAVETDAWLATFRASERTVARTFRGSRATPSSLRMSVRAIESR